MKIKDIHESTTSGSIASVASPLGKTQTRAGKLFKGKKTNKPFYEDEVNEADLILVPGHGSKLKPGFIPKDKDRTDHEVEMARSDLYQAAKNAKKVYELIQSISEEQGLEGWVQEKIIKANDYLNTIREYLEHKTYMQEMTGGVLAGGMSNFEEGVAEGSLEEIDRRGFLKGVGAAAMTGAAGSAMAAPFKHSQNVDPMTDKVQGRNSTVVSDDGSVKLYIEWNRGAWLDLKSAMFNPNEEYGRIKFGDGPAERFEGLVDRNTFRSIQLGGSSEAPAIAKKILKHSGKIKIEVQIFRVGSKVFTFTIEQDAKTKNIKEQGVAESKCPECGGIAFSEESIAEAKDACYNKVKSRYKVWPSAYASGALVKCRKVGASNWGNSSKK